MGKFLKGSQILRPGPRPWVAIFFTFFLGFVRTPLCWAQATWVTGHFQAGYGSLLDFQGRGEYGFADSSPVSLFSEVRYAGSPTPFRDNALDLGEEFSYSGLRWGGGARIRYLKTTGTELAVVQWGAELRMRLLSSSELSATESTAYGEARKRDILKEKQSKVQDEKTLAPQIIVTYDNYGLRSTGASLTGSSLHLGAKFLWKPLLNFHLLPSFDFFSPDFTSDTVLQGAVASPHLRLLRWGLLGSQSSLAGIPHWAARIHFHWQTEPFFALEWGGGMARMADPAGGDGTNALPFRMAVLSDFGPDHRWQLSAAYEHIIQNGSARPHFGVEITYHFVDFTEPYAR